MNSMKLVIPLHFISWKKDSKRCCDTTTPGLIHTKDESKRGSAFAFIFGVNWPLQWDVREWQVSWNSIFMWYLLLHRLSSPLLTMDNLLPLLKLASMLEKIWWLFDGCIVACYRAKVGYLMLWFYTHFLCIRKITIFPKRPPHYRGPCQSIEPYWCEQTFGQSSVRRWMDESV